MDALLNIVQTILGMGAVVILPIMIFFAGTSLPHETGGCTPSRSYDRYRISRIAACH